jgi:hypothetical protein
VPPQAAVEAHRVTETHEIHGMLSAGRPSAAGR